MKLLIVFLAFLTIAGCEDHDGPAPDRNDVNITETLAIYRGSSFADTGKVWHDEKRRVTCWQVDRGLSCIPDWMLADKVVKP